MQKGAIYIRKTDQVVTGVLTLGVKRTLKTGHRGMCACHRDTWDVRAGEDSLMKKAEICYRIIKSNSYIKEYVICHLF